MNKNILLFGSVLLIVLAVAMAALLNRTSSTSTSSDVRARAAATKTLQFNGTVGSVDETKNLVIVENMYLADVSRAGDPKSMGTWEVTAPANFNFASISPGQNIIIGIDAKTFLAESHTVTAVTITPAL